MSLGEQRQVQMRWGDIDALGHVNHALAFTYFEEARDAFLAERGISRDSYVVGRCEVWWKRELTPGHPAVTVETAVSELGTSSMTTLRADLRRRGQRRRRGRVRARALGLGGARRAPDHRHRAPGADLVRRADPGGGTAMSKALELGPRRDHLRDHRRRRLPRHQPERPLHDRGDRERRRSAPPRPGRRSPTCTCARTTARRAAGPSSSSTRSSGSAPAARS